MLEALRRIFGRCDHQWQVTDYSVIKKHVRDDGVREAITIADMRQCVRCGDMQTWVF